MTLVIVCAIVYQLHSYTLMNTSLKAELIFQDRFDDEKTLSQYTQAKADQGYEAGTWRIKEGRLYGQKIHNAALWLSTLKLPKNVRIEFDAWTHEKAGDLKCEIFGDGRHHQSGYIVIAGGWNNRLNIIARQDEHGEDRKKDARCSQYKHIGCNKKDQVQHWRIERYNDRLMWFVDEKLIMYYDDIFPMEGEYFAFNNWSAATSFDNLEVYHLSH